MKIPGLAIQLDASDLPWRETKQEGVAWLPLFLEGESGAAGGDATVLIQMAPGAGYPAHRHIGAEDVLVLAGGYRDELGEYRVGEHIRYPAGSSHAPVALGDPSQAVTSQNPACVLYAVAQGGVELL